MRQKLGKNNQQWIFDWVINTTGKAEHWELESWAKLPPEVKSWDMIPKGRITKLLIPPNGVGPYTGS